MKSTILVLAFGSLTAHAAPLLLDGGAATISATRRPWDAGRAQRGSNYGFALVVSNPVSTPRATPGSSSTITEQDRTVQRTVGIATVTDYVWSWSPAPENTVAGTVTRESSAPSVIAPTAGDEYRWTYVGSGTATIRLITSSGITYQRQVTTSTAGAGTTDILLGYAEGSLRKHVNDTVDAELAGKSATTAIKIFSSGTTRNSNLWTSCDLTGTTASGWGGVVIAPDIVLYAAHAHPGIGSSATFVTAGGEVVSRTITAGYLAPGYAPYWPDWWLAKLSSPLPVSIRVAKFLPANWEDYLPGNMLDYRVPSVGLNQFREATVQDVVAVVTSGQARFGTASPSDLKRAEFFRKKIGGDSSSPAILPVNGAPVVLTVWTSGGSGAGTAMADPTQRAAIDAGMTALGSAYQTQSVDLSGFTAY